MRAGQLIEISDGNRRAIITEQGATLYRLIWDEVEILDTASEDGYAGAGCHGQLLMPWPGRVRDGKYEFDGQPYQLPINDLGHHAAIHGWARWATWQVREHRNDCVTLTYRTFATPGYPWPLEFEQTYAWARSGLQCRTVVKNAGADTAPFGFGQHPYFTLGAPVIDGGLLQLPASQYFEAQDDLTPKFPALAVEGTELDYRQPRPVGQSQLDVTFTGLERDDEGLATAVFAKADGSLKVICRYDEAVTFLQIFSGDTLQSGRRHGLAIEPYTCLPDAFNNGVGLLRLNPGAAAKVGWTVTVSS